MENFGCRAARADGEAIAESLHAAGHDCMEQPSEADVVIVNSCSVTAEADRAARAYIRRMHRRNPQARIVVTGCYAQRAPEELAKLEGVAAVVGNSHKALAPEVAAALLTHETRESGAATSGRSQPAPSLVAGRGLNRAESGSVNNDRTFAPGASLFPVQSLLNGTVPIFADDRFAHSFLEEVQIVPGAQTRPNLKIQEGCENRCTFCVIPFTRGPSRSLTPEAVLGQVRGFVQAGGHELVLSGINLGRWGRDLTSELFQISESRPAASGPGRPNLTRLVRRILGETDLARVRLSSIEPMDWDNEMIALMAEFCRSRLCRHAHLPLQSGSDAVLRRMHRRYRPWHYAEKVAELFRAVGPELTLGADVMVGFPGETDAEFKETLEFVRGLPFGYLHLFPFSPRPGTRGWALHLADPVSAAAVGDRMAALRALAAEKMHAHREQFIGRELEAITLHTPTEMAVRGRTNALSDNFLPIEIEGRLPANLLVQVRVAGLNAETVLEAMPEHRLHKEHTEVEAAPAPIG